MMDCKHERTLEVLYQKPDVKSLSRKKLIAKKMVFRNDKLYLYGYDLTKDDTVVLNCKNIDSVVSRKLTEKGMEPNMLKVILKLKNAETEMLTDEEKIVEINDSEALIEGNYFNEFLAIQRILSFGSKCTIVEDRKSVV